MNHLLNYFLDLVQIDSESREELDVARKLEKDLIALGANVEFDDTGSKIGGNCGNLYAFHPGTSPCPPLMFSAHMDTVKPGKGVKPRVEDGRVVTDGTTILGSDDKSGIAQVVIAIKELIEAGEHFPPVEILFTVAEEVGLLGSRHADYSKFKSTACVALDSHGIGKFVNGAPSQNSIKFIVHGREAHAGIEPEAGINAIRIAAEAIAKAPSGRIDFETTCNIGLIEGGMATNIVPKTVVVKGEARSHKDEKVENVTARIVSAFQEAAASYSTDDFTASVDCIVNREYNAFLISRDEQITRVALQAAANVGLDTGTTIGGGGSDANIFNEHGIRSLIMATGMENIHTEREFIRVDDLRAGCDIVKEMLRLWAGKES